MGELFSCVPVLEDQFLRVCNVWETKKGEAAFGLVTSASLLARKLTAGGRHRPCLSRANSLLKFDFS